MLNYETNYNNNFPVLGIGSKCYYYSRQEHECSDISRCAECQCRTICQRNLCKMAMRWLWRNGLITMLIQIWMWMIFGTIWEYGSPFRMVIRIIWWILACNLNWYLRLYQKLITIKDKWLWDGFYSLLFSCLAWEQ